MPKGFLTDAHGVCGHEIVDEADLRDQVFARNKESFDAPGHAPFDDGRLGIAEHAGSGRDVHEVVAIIEVGFKIVSQESPLPVIHMDKQFAVLVPFPAVSFTARSVSGRDIITMRVDLAELEVFDHVPGFNGVPSCLLSRVVTRDEAALQKPTRSAFADVRDPVKLLLGDGFWKIPANSFNVLFEFGHADTAFRFSADGGGVALSSNERIRARSLLNSLLNAFFSPKTAQMFDLFEFPVIAEKIEAGCSKSFIFSAKH